MANLASIKLTAAKMAYLPSRYPRLFIFRATRMAMSSTVHHSSDAGAANSIKTLADLPGPLNFPIIKSAWTVLLLGFSGEPLGKRMLSLQAEGIKKYGKIYLIEIPDFKAVQLSDPADVETVLRNEPKYPQRRGLGLLSSIIIEKNARRNLECFSPMVPYGTTTEV